MKKFDPRSRVKVREYILNGISSGEFPPGSKLPSYRELVWPLQVSQDTIQAVMQALGEEGVVKRVSGLGWYVTPEKKECRTLETIGETVSRVAMDSLKYAIDHRVPIDWRFYLDPEQFPLICRCERRYLAGTDHCAVCGEPL